MAISLLPVIFMFFVSYSLLNRTIGPLVSQAIGNCIGRDAEVAERSWSWNSASSAHAGLPGRHARIGDTGIVPGACAVEWPGRWCGYMTPKGILFAGESSVADQPEDRTLTTCTVAGVQGTLVRALPSGVEIWEANGQNYFTSRVPAMLDGQKPGSLVVGYRTGPDFLKRWAIIQSQTREYENVKQNLRALKRQMLLILFFFTILVLSAATWVALFLAKQVTVPIQALAEGTRGDFRGQF